MSTEDLGHLRKTYQKGNLEPSEIQNEPLLFYTKWLEEAIEHPEIDEANAMTLTTLGLDNYPRGRVVLLKAVTERGFIFYTNYKSDKGQAIAHHNKVGLSFFWPALERQVHIKGEASKIPSEQSDTYFSSRPKGSQLGAIVSDQSTVISDRSILEIKLESLELEYKTKTIQRPEFWGGYEVVASSIEFWQGRPNRLHDRVRCQWISGFWNIERLAP
jgi:pyridoxamine 5'-phosphate oxidase